MGAELTVPMVLLAGIISFASPCFLPVVPVFVSYMVGQGGAQPSGGTATGVDAESNGTAQSGPASNRTLTASAVATRRATRRAAIGQAVTFVAGFTLVFIALWALVGVIGFVAYDVRVVLRIVGGAVLVLLGLHLAELIRLPFLDRTLKVSYSPAMAERPTHRRSFLLGLAFAAGWTPCIGPVLGGVIGLATSSGSMGSGLGLLLVYSLGLGLPFVLVCAGATTLTTHLSWFTRHHRAVSIASGALLMVIGFLMITDLFARIPALASPLS